MGYLSTVLLRALEQGPLAERMAKLEAMLGLATNRPTAVLSAHGNPRMIGMTNAEKRLCRIENELDFKIWLRKSRMVSVMTADELETFAVTGHWPDRPEPAPGTSRLDSMDRVSLEKLWEEDRRQFEGRSGDELEFYAIHGHWPEQAREATPTCHPKSRE